MTKKFLLLFFILTILIGSFTLAEIFHPEEGGALVKNQSIGNEPFAANTSLKIEQNIDQRGLEKDFKTIIPVSEKTGGVSITNTEVVDEKESAHLEILNNSGQRSYSVETRSDDTVEKIMRRAQKQGLQFSSKDFKGLGSYVTAVNGIEEDAKKGMFWVYYVNGKKAATGISNQKVLPNDIIHWRYEKI